MAKVKCSDIRVGDLLRVTVRGERQIYRFWTVTAVNGSSVYAQLATGISAAFAISRMHTDFTKLTGILLEKQGRVCSCKKKHPLAGHITTKITQAGRGKAVRHTEKACGPMEKR